MVTLAFYNLKGGVGKTASTINLAYLAAKAGYNTLVWDLDPQGSASFYLGAEAQMKRKPNSNHASVYSAVMHYLKAVQAAGTDDTAAVIKKMQDTPINDMFAKNGKLRPDGRMVHDMYLFQVKKPSESKGPWDYYHLKGTVKGEEAFQSLALTFVSNSECS